MSKYHGWFSSLTPVILTGEKMIVVLTEEEIVDKEKVEAKILKEENNRKTKERDSISR